MSRVGSLYVGIGLDSKNFKKDLDNLYGKLKLSKQQFKTTTAQMGDFSKMSDKLKVKSKSLAGQIQTQKSIVDKLNDAFLKSKEVKGYHNLIDAINEEDIDVVIASRLIPGGGVVGSWPQHRKFTSHVATFLAKPLTSVNDTMSGFFALKKIL